MKDEKYKVKNPTGMAKRMREAGENLGTQSSQSPRDKAIRRKMARNATKPMRDKRNAIKEFNGHEPRTF